MFRFSFSFSNDQAVIARALERRQKDPIEKALMSHASLCIALLFAVGFGMLLPLPELVFAADNFLQTKLEQSFVTKVTLLGISGLMVILLLGGMFWKELQYRQIVGEKRIELVPFMRTQFRRCFTIYFLETFISCLGIRHFENNLQSSACLFSRAVFSLVGIGILAWSERSADSRALCEVRKKLSDAPPEEVKTYLAIFPACFLVSFLAPFLLILASTQEIWRPSITSEKLTGRDLLGVFALYSFFGLGLSYFLLSLLKKRSKQGAFRSELSRYCGDFEVCIHRANFAVFCGMTILLALFVAEKTGVFIETGKRLAEARFVSGLLLFVLSAYLQRGTRVLLRLLRKLRIPESESTVKDESSAAGSLPEATTL